MLMRGRACRKTIGNGSGRFPARRGCWMGACSPAGGDPDYFLDDVSTGQARLDRPEAIRRRLAGTGDAQLVLGAYTQIPRVVISDGVVIINPGCVGMPAYDDDRRPVAHVIEAGSPHGRYALVALRLRDGASTCGPFLTISRLLHDKRSRPGVPTSRLG